MKYIKLFNNDIYSFEYIDLSFENWLNNDILVLDFYYRLYPDRMKVRDFKRKTAAINRSFFFVI